MPARDPGRPRFADVADGIDEEPVRFLTFASALALARIRGIDRIDVVRNLIETELEVGDDRPNGPRSAIVGALHRRIQELRENGEHDDTLQQRCVIDQSGSRTRSPIWRNRSGRRSDPPRQDEITDRGDGQ